MAAQQSDQKTKEEVYDEERKRREREKEKERTKLKSSKIEEQVETHKPKKIEIPIVELDEPKIEPKEVKIDKEIPDIKVEEQKISIPIVELEKPVMELKQVKLDKTLPKVEIRESGLEIPLIRLGRSRDARSIITVFDERLPQTRPVIRRTLRVPICKISSKSATREIVSTFDTKVDTQLLWDLIGSEELKEIGKERLLERQKFEGSVKSAEAEPPGGEEELERIPDVTNFIFSISNSRISSKGPKVILYKELEKDSTIGSFETLCIRIYREKEGGHPKLQPIKKLDEFNIKEIERWVEADKKIVTIDLDKDKEKANKWFCEDNLREPVRRAIIGDIGFIIFKTRDTNLYEYCKKVLENLEEEIEHPLNVLYFEPKPLLFEKKKELSSLTWGNLRLEADELAIKSPNFERFVGTGVLDDIFNKLSKRLFEESLEKLKDSAYSNATKPHEGEESMEHKEMKWFVVKYLTEKLIKNGILRTKNPKKPKAFEINNVIKTEEDTEDKLEGKRTDIMDTHNSEVYEIETLFAEDREGRTPEEKLNYTIDKYKGLSKVKKINIVLDNLTFLRHLKTLHNVKLNKPKEERERVEFYTFDLQNNSLLPFSKVVNKIKQLEKT